MAIGGWTEPFLPLCCLLVVCVVQLTFTDPFPGSWIVFCVVKGRGTITVSAPLDIPVPDPSTVDLDVCVGAARVLCC
jgi:hypothetical protein